MARQRSYPNPVREISQGDAESWTHWWVFSPQLTEEQVEDFLYDNDMESRYYSGPGGAFSSRGHVEDRQGRVNSFTFIQQSGGLDI
jgi:hypothetical protein